MEVERFEYPDGTVALQYRCPSPGCDRGMKLSPARFCGRCGGSGYVVSWTTKEEEANDAAVLETQVQAPAGGAD